MTTNVTGRPACLPLSRWSVEGSMGAASRSPPRGIHRLLEVDRPAISPSRDPPHLRQLRHPQAPGGPGLARRASPLSPALHAHQRLLAQLRGALVCPHHGTSHPPRKLRSPSGPPARPGPAVTRPRCRLLSPLHTGDSFSIRAGLSRRPWGRCRDLYAGVSAAAAQGVNALPPRRAAHRGVPPRVPRALRQAARPAASGRRARARGFVKCGDGTFS